MGCVPLVTHSQSSKLVIEEVYIFYQPHSGGGTLFSFASRHIPLLLPHIVFAWSGCPSFLEAAPQPRICIGGRIAVAACPYPYCLADRASVQIRRQVGNYPSCYRADKSPSFHCLKLPTCAWAAIGHTRIAQPWFQPGLHCPALSTGPFPSPGSSPVRPFADHDPSRAP